MKGAIFNLFEDFVTTRFGADVYDEILETTTLETTEPFVGPGTYPATDLLALVATTTEVLAVSPEAALRSFGRFAFPILATSVAPLMQGLDSPRQFLEKLESVLHLEVRKLDPSASPARFRVAASGPDEMTLEYQSPFGLFALVSGFIDGIADWYRCPLEHELTATDGTNGTFVIRFPPGPWPGAATGLPVGAGIGTAGDDNHA